MNYPKKDIALQSLVLLTGVFLGIWGGKIAEVISREDGVYILDSDEEITRIVDDRDLAVQISRVAENVSFVTIFRGGKELVYIYLPTNITEDVSVSVFSQNDGSSLGELSLEFDDCSFEYLKE